MTHRLQKAVFHLMVVDDLELHLIIVKLEDFLKKRKTPYAISHAPNGKKAWEICKNKEFDFYIIDYCMPEMNGVDLCRKILENNPQAPIVLYSASNLKKIEKVEGLIQGKPIGKKIHFIQKDIFQLLKHIDEHLLSRENKAGDSA